MALVSRVIDIYYTFRFLRQLVTPWTETQAYKLGIVDENGKKLRNPITSEEKDSYTLFFRLVYNIKRLLNKVPLGKTKLASYAAALWLIHENTKMSEAAVFEGFKKFTNNFQLDYSNTLTENKSWMIREGNLLPGKYRLSEHIVSPVTGDLVAYKGSMIIVNEASAVPQGQFAGIDIYSVYHPSSKQKVYVTLEDIYR